MRTSSVDEVILDTFAGSREHLTSRQVYDRIRGRLPAVNPSTVYRSLDRLVKRGEVSVSDMGTGADVYELVSEDVHHHLVCQQCGRVTTLDRAEVQGFFETLQSRSGFQVTTNHLVLFGICPACRKLAG
jgi:Fur family transcriptional regulator, ferric uptake regulator